MIEVVNIRKRFRRRSILRDVSFAVERGEIVCLIGPNGAGKSTIMKAIMGLVPIDGGAIRIDGKARTPHMYEKVAFIPDRPIMPGTMRIAEALRFMEDFYASWQPEKAAELMRFFQLEPGERVGNLSKGTAAKFNLVTGLALDADYVLMDEPFAGIDLFSRERIAEVFSSEWVEGRGVLLTTHEIGETEHLLDRAVLLHEGTIERIIDCEQMRDEEGKSVIDVMREVYAP